MADSIVTDEMISRALIGYWPNIEDHPTPSNGERMRAALEAAAPMIAAAVKERCLLAIDDHGDATVNRSTINALMRVSATIRALDITGEK